MSRYIDAEKLANDIYRAWELWEKKGEDCYLFADVITPMLVGQPTADVVEVVYAEWIKMDKRGNNVRCSKCGNTLDLRGVNAGRGDANYCPNCGTKMSTQSNAFLTH